MSHVCETISHGTWKIESHTHISHVCAAHQSSVCVWVMTHAEWSHVHVYLTYAHMYHTYVYASWHMSHGTRRMQSRTHLSHVCAAHQSPVCAKVIAHAEWNRAHVHLTYAHMCHAYVYESWHRQDGVMHTYITRMCCTSRPYVCVS